MEDTDFNEETFDMIGPNAPQEVKDAWIEAAKEEGDVDNIDILGNTTESAIQATKQALYEEYRLAGYVEELDRFLNKVSNGNVTVDDLEITSGTGASSSNFISGLPENIADLVNHAVAVSKYYYYKQMIYDVLAYKKENGTIPRYQIQMDVGGN